LAKMSCEKVVVRGRGVEGLIVMVCQKRKGGSPECRPGISIHNKPFERVVMKVQVDHWGNKIKNTTLKHFKQGKINSKEPGPNWGSKISSIKFKDSRYLGWVEYGHKVEEEYRGRGKFGKAEGVNHVGN